MDKSIIKTLAWLLVSAISLAAYGDTSEEIKYLGKVTIGNSEDKPVLGISSLRFDASKRQYILLSDDTGAVDNKYDQRGHARYYTISESDIWDGTQVIELGDNWSDIVKEVVIEPNSAVGAIGRGPYRY